MDHWISLFIRKRCQTGRYIFQYLHKDTAQTAKHHVSELLFIFCTNKQFCSFKHRLNHNRFRIGNLHHAVKFESQMLLTFNIQHHSTYIWFMHRPHHLSYYRKSASPGKIHDLFFLIGNKFINQWNTGCMQQSLYIMRFNITIFRDRINDTTDSRHIDSKQFNLRNRRSRSVDNTGKSCS